MDTMNNNGYQGWKNYETWNVALYIQNDYKLYQVAKGCKSYTHFLARAGIVKGQTTADRVSWYDSRISKQEVTQMIRELSK